MIIGITGKIATGKTYVSKYICDKYLGIYISTDILAKGVMKEKNVNVDINNIDDDFVKKNIHPLVWEKVRYIINNVYNNITKDNNIIILVETALPNEDFYDICDTVVLTESKNNKERLIKTNKYTDEKINILLNKQTDYEKFYKMAKYVIINDTNLLSLRRQVDNIMEKLLNKK